MIIVIMYYNFLYQLTFFAKHINIQREPQSGFTALFFNIYRFI